MSDVVGKYFKAWAGPGIEGNAIYFCDSYDPAVDYWMTPINRTDVAKRTDVSPRAIDRTFHRVWTEEFPMWCRWGPLTADEADAIIRHQVSK